MKNKKFKLNCVIIITCIALIANAQEQNQNRTNVNNIFVRQTDTLITNIGKDDIVKWLKKYVTPATPYRNKFINDILENALFENRYLQRKGPGDNGKLLIVPLKHSYFSQHMSHTGPRLFQNLLIDLDKSGGADKIFTINLSHIYLADSLISTLPSNTFSKFFNQSEPFDGKYALISIIQADFKFTDIDIRNNERVQHRSWRSTKFGDNTYEWVLETDHIIRDQNGSIKINTSSQKLGTSKTVSPPMFKGDLRTQVVEK